MHNHKQEQHYKVRPWFTQNPVKSQEHNTIFKTYICNFSQSHWFEGTAWEDLKYWRMFCRVFFLRDWKAWCHTLVCARIRTLQCSTCWVEISTHIWKKWKIRKKRHTQIIIIKMVKPTNWQSLKNKHISHQCHQTACQHLSVMTVFPNDYMTWSKKKTKNVTNPTQIMINFTYKIKNKTDHFIVTNMSDRVTRH